MTGYIKRTFYRLSCSEQRMGIGSLFMRESEQMVQEFQNNDSEFLNSKTSEITSSIAHDFIKKKSKLLE